MRGVPNRRAPCRATLGPCHQRRPASLAPTHHRQVLADLGKTSSDFRQLATKALDQLCGALMPRLRPVLDEAAAAGYELGEADMAHGGGASGWPRALLLAFAVHLAWLQPLLAPEAYDALVHLVLDKVGVQAGAAEGCRARGRGRLAGRGGRLELQTTVPSLNTEDGLATGCIQRVAAALASTWQPGAQRLFQRLPSFYSRACCQTLGPGRRWWRAWRRSCLRSGLRSWAACSWRKTCGCWLVS